MRRNSFVPACLYLLLTKHVKAYEGRNECKDGNVINAISGQNLKLTIDIEPLTRCYVVFTDNEGGNQCCFNEKGSDEDCNASNGYKQRNNTKCPVYDIAIVDNQETHTCTLFIKGASEDSVGQFKSYDADHVFIQACDVTVSHSHNVSGGTIAAIIIVVTTLVMIMICQKCKGRQNPESEILMEEGEGGRVGDLNPNISPEESVQLMSIDGECELDGKPDIPSDSDNLTRTTTTSIIKEKVDLTPNKPLSTPQPEFDHDGHTFNGCLLLHRLLVTGQEEEVLRRRLELSPLPPVAWLQQYGEILQAGCKSCLKLCCSTVTIGDDYWPSQVANLT